MGTSGGNLPPSPVGRPSSRTFPYATVAVAVILTAVVPLGFAIFALSIRYVNGQKALIRTVERICILNHRIGKERVLVRQFINCDDFETERAALSGQYVGWEYGRRVRIETELRGKPFFAQLDMSLAELQQADRGGELWIARMEHPRQTIVVMPDWTYVFSPVTRTIEFFRDNPGIWAVPLAPLVLKFMMDLAIMLYRMVFRRQAGGPT
ncbi:hypothetical protein [Bosea sp. (in: a-proteobacteria)]|uniref:hypothetical protein n=1 Tax=Bosea sp. (in: a-proteobacteria) TaxID=1871050 RepID=UPI003F6FC068